MRLAVYAERMVGMTEKSESVGARREISIMINIACECGLKVSDSGYRRVASIYAHDQISFIIEAVMSAGYTSERLLARQRSRLQELSIQ
jgi:hypothetical protein